MSAVEFLLLAAYAGFVVVGAYIADSKNQGFWPWLLLGFFIPLITVVIVLLLPDHSDDVPPPEASATSSATAVDGRRLALGVAVAVFVACVIGAGIASG